MSDSLRKVIEGAQANFRAEPAEAQVTFESKSNLQQVFHSEVAMRDHHLTVDEPEWLGGTDKGPNPVELVLAALGTCQEITYRAYAAAMGIPLEGVSVTVEGDIDLRGFFPVADDVRPGYGAMRATVELTSSAGEEQLNQLRDTVNSHCPVLDIVTNPVPVDLELKINEPAVA